MMTNQHTGDNKRNWTNSDGSWDDPANWSGDAVPTARQTAKFTTGATSGYIVSGDGTADHLHVDDAVTLSGTISLSRAKLDGAGTLTLADGAVLSAAAAGTLSADLTVDDFGRMTTAGMVVSGVLEIGDGTGDTGALQDTGGIEITSEAEIDLYRGTMTAAQGVTVDAGGTLALGRHGVLDGIITLAGGTLASQNTGAGSGYVASVPGDLVVSAKSVLQGDDGVTLLVRGAVTSDTGDTLLIAGDPGVAPAMVELAGAVSVAGGITVEGGNTLLIDQNYSGAVVIDADATLRIGTALTDPHGVHYAAASVSGGVAHGGVLGGTLSVLGHSNLSASGFALGDAIDISDVDALKHKVTTSYDAGTGRLQILVDTVLQQTIVLPARLTSGGACFSVATDGSGGTTIALVQGPTGLPATAVGAQGAWQQGVTGSGVTVGVISDGFDSNGGLWQSVANGLLPANVLQVYKAGWDMANAQTDEGRAMAEIVHEVAPGANILFSSQSADANDGQALPAGAVSAFDAHMAESVDRLAEAKATVIVDDVTSPGEPFYDTNTLLSKTIAKWEQLGVVFVTSASNRGGASYEHAISVEQTATLSDNASELYAYRFNDGTGEPGFLQKITIAGGSEGIKPIIFQWADTGSSAYSLHLQIYTKTDRGYTNTGIRNSGTSTNQIYDPPGAGTYYIAVVSDSSDPVGTFKFVLDYKGDSVAGNPSPGSGSITGHDLDPNEITVGAVNYDDTPAAGGQLKSESFSSSGPGALLVNQTLVPQSKPDLSAAQRTPTSVTGVASAGNPTGISGLNDFGGTSAAAPVVAAAAAMIKQVDRNMDASDIRNLLKDSCWAMQDTVTAGSGLLRADLAVGYAQTHVITQFAGGNSALLGTSGNDRIVTSLGDTTVDGAGGNDTISAGGQSTSVVGGSGLLLVDVSSGALSLSGGTGSATVHGGGAGSLVVGGSAGRNLLQGGGGGALWGGGASDTVSGGAGDLIGSAGFGNSTLVGSTGNTLVDGNGTLAFTGNTASVFAATTGGQDTVVGTGTFTAIGRGGDTTVFGGAGSATVWAKNATVTDVAGSGHGTLVVGSGHTDLWIGQGVGAQDILALAGSGGGSVSVFGYRAGVDCFSTRGYAAGSATSSVHDGSLTITLSDHSSITFIGSAALV